MESFMSKNGQSMVVTWIFGERTPNMCQCNFNEIFIIIIFGMSNFTHLHSYSHFVSIVSFDFHEKY